MKIGEEENPNLQVTTRNNEYRGNVLYREAVRDIAAYRGESMCVSALNAKSGTYGDIIEDNVQIDPLFNDPANHDFAFRPESACSTP